MKTYRARLSAFVLEQVTGLRYHIPPMRMLRLIALCLLVLFGLARADASSMDWRLYFVADTTGVLAADQGTAYLFQITDEGELASISDVVSQGAVQTLNAMASGAVDVWSSSSFMAFVSDEDPHLKPLVWAVVVGGVGWQTGRVERQDGVLSGEGDQFPLVGYETDPATGEAVGFAILQASDVIKLNRFAAVPEPTTSLLVVLGLAFLVLKRRD